MLVLNVVGILVIRSATYPSTSQVGKQIFGVVVAFVMAAVISLIDYHKIFRFNTFIYLGCIALLLLVLFFGEKVNGATRWVKLPLIGQVQPSEFTKIGLIVVFSWYLGKYQEKINKVAVLGGAALLAIVPIALIINQPNLSTSLVITFVLVCMIYTAGISYKWIVGVLAVMLPAFGIFVYLLQYEMIPFIKGYQANRILAKIFPTNTKYAELNRQQNNSIMAIGSGQLKGKGLNNNTLTSVKNGNFLSEEQTDFIFAVIGEELGFIRSVIVIVIFALLVYECLLMAHRARDLSGRLICTGMAALIAFQSFANIAVATGIFPNTGLPLPFISYGVSSLFSIYIGMGLVLNVGLQRKNNR